MASTIDLLPTLAKLAGAQLPTGRVIDGRDIYPLMVGQKDATSPHEAFYFYGGTTLKAVRSGTWKLFLSGGAGTRNTKNARARGKAGNQQPRLYDLSADLGEKANVAEAHPEVVKRMTDLANKFDEQLKKDRRPIGNID